jgi:hypothetical protein
VTLWRRRRATRDARRASDGRELLADECEAYLAGHLARVWSGDASAIPAWIRLNELVHAPPEQIIAIAADADAGAARSWSTVRAALAAVLVRAGGRDPQRIRRLQIDALLALEGRLAQHDVLVTPRRLVELVESSLDAYDAS